MQGKAGRGCTADLPEGFRESARQPIVKIEHYRLAQEDQRNPRVEEEQAPYGDQPAKS